jgi:hypothetical protein
LKQVFQAIVAIALSLVALAFPIIAIVGSLAALLYLGLLGATSASRTHDGEPAESSTVKWQ